MKTQFVPMAERIANAPKKMLRQSTKERLLGYLDTLGKEGALDLMVKELGNVIHAQRRYVLPMLEQAIEERSIVSDRAEMPWTTK